MTGIDRARDALGRRLHAVAPVLVGRELDALPPADALDVLARAVAAEPRDDRIWLLATAIAGGYPTADEVALLRRGLLLAAPGAEFGALLAGIAGTAAAARASESDLELVEGGVLVDVHFCATRAHNTGIQRVVRSTAPDWAARGAVPVAWSPDGTGYRRLTPQQEELALRWRSGMPEPGDAGEPTPLVVPVGGTLLVPEVPAAEHLDRLVGIARATSTRVGLIGYDAIPVVSAEHVPLEESDRFAHYLTLVKHADVVSCISETTAEEFRGIRHALAAQGIAGPEVVAALLPQQPPPAEPEPAPERELPLVLTVGSVEPRKNQLGVLAAARMLHARGIGFELVFVGGGSASELHRLRRGIRDAEAAGVRVALRSGLADAELAQLYASARCVAFPSLQEGYGLPVAEALALGVPVVTTRYGSTAEVAAGGGCVLVDPRDDAGLADAIGRVLVDDGFHEELRREIAQRPSHTWGDYAELAWSQLVAAR